MNEKIMNILIADDDEAIVDATSIMLEALGHNVYQVTDGNIVIQTVKVHRPDLVLLDIWMSGVDGRDVCRALKNDKDIKDTPVLMISASRQIKASALSCGADDFLAKPFEMLDLIEKIEKLVENPQLQEGK